MNQSTKTYLSLIAWIVGLLLVGWVLGVLTETAIHTWYVDLNRSQLTPPNSVFGPVWTVLYVLIGICGWLIFQRQTSNQPGGIKTIYVIQLLLNWFWTPLFFYYQLTGLALLCLLLLDMTVAILIYRCYSTQKLVSLLMFPYFIWIVFATYLNYYIYVHTF